MFEKDSLHDFDTVRSLCWQRFALDAASLPLSCCRPQEEAHMVFDSHRAVAHVYVTGRLSARVATAVRLMSIGAVVCLSLAGCGGSDDDTTQSSASSNAATSQSDSQLGSPTVANAVSASNGLAPPVMHYAQ
ncbi:MAG TPA: hypothetical protein VL424_13500 [Pararobbsia sp.]|nr:hypothetical protein [Pararobbsia sp.]